MLRKFFGTNNDILPVILRLTLGVVMFPHGAQKLLGWFGGDGFSGTMGYFTGNGLPAAIAFLVIMAESFGSLGLIFGFLTRFSAFGIALNMLGAIFTVHLKTGFFMNWTGKQSGEGFEFHLLVLGIALALMIRGGGAGSIDGVIEKKLQ